MEAVQRIVDVLEYGVFEFGIPVGTETIPLVVIILISAGVYFTLRLGFVQLRRFGHGLAVATGRYDDPNEPGDVSHFQALSTALSATVGVGNIAGVAVALHWGGPGALFWMWVTGALGMATKYVEVTASMEYRSVREKRPDDPAWTGTVSGGPMYYIEQGLGKAWKPMAVFFALSLGFSSFLAGNGVQSNTIADVLQTQFSIPFWVSGLAGALIVGSVIIGGISRIGRVTGIIAPAMASLYVAGAMVIIILNVDQLLPSLALIVTEAFNPTAGIAGTGVGVFLVTALWGIRRGLFSNEAGLGSAPIAHAAAQTDEPVSEGVVALLGPFIDTIVICTMTALVIIMTGSWDDRFATEINLASGDAGFVEAQPDGQIVVFAGAPAVVEVRSGVSSETGVGVPRLAWHQVAVDTLYTDSALTQLFTGSIFPNESRAVAADGTEYPSLFGNAVQNGAPLTMLAFQRGLPGEWGHWIVVITVLLFAISTAIAWSYYGDRCAVYLFGDRALMPYKVVFVIIHFLGAVAPLTVAWVLADVVLFVAAVPNLIAVIILTPRVKVLTDSYFERRPWLENAEVHRRRMEERRLRKDR
jgi:AGCS family alanine or glycine:cation symporter